MRPLADDVRCVADKAGGGRCGAARLHDDDQCFQHSDTTREEAAQGRRLGGHRRRKEGVVQASYEFEGFGTVEGITRYLDIAGLDTLALESSLARSRTMTQIARAAMQLLSMAELEERLRAVESALEVGK